MINTEILILQINHQLTFSDCEKFLSCLSEFRQQKIQKLYFEKDKLLSLFAGLLVRYQIIQKLHIPNQKIQFYYGTHGKPHLLNDHYHFSLSHSGQYAAFADSSFPIGIDIEQTRKADFRIAEAYFSSQELQFLQNSPDPDSAFFMVWTAKEAYLKMTGEGLTVPLNSFCTVSGIPDHHFLHLQIPGYAVSLCLHQTLKAGIPVFLDCVTLMQFFKNSL